MRPSKGACSFLLLFLVVALLPPPTYGRNPRYEHFLSQHQDDPKSNFHGRYCDSIMRRRDLTRPECKDMNTFIHGTKRQIQAVCNEGGVPYGQLRRSLQHFRVTTCTHKGGSPRPPCKYKENNSPRYIVIDCENGWPVHYDESQILTTV